MTTPPPIPLDPSLVQTDKSHLSVIAIFHYILGGLSIVSIGGIAIHYFIMDQVFNNPEFFERIEKIQDNQEIPVELNGGELFDGFFKMMVVSYIFGTVFLLVSGIGLIVSGRFIHQSKNRIFSIVVAAISCTFFPFGTVLGIFTLIKLCSVNVVRMYAETKPNC